MIYVNAMRCADEIPEASSPCGGIRIACYPGRAFLEAFGSGYASAHGGVPFCAVVAPSMTAEG